MLHPAACGTAPPKPSSHHRPLRSERDLVGFLLGMASIGFWMVAQIPQLVANYRSKRADALSAWFLAEWLLVRAGL